MSGSDRRDRRRFDIRRFILDTRPLAVPPYRRLWSSTIVTAVGSQLTAVAVPSRSTTSPARRRTSACPAWSPWSRWSSSRSGAARSPTPFDRRKLLLVTNGGLAITSFLLWAQAAAPQLVWLVFTLLALQQACFGSNSRRAAPRSRGWCRHRAARRERAERDRHSDRLDRRAAARRRDDPRARPLDAVPDRLLRAARHDRAVCRLPRAAAVGRRAPTGRPPRGRSTGSATCDLHGCCWSRSSPTSSRWSSGCRGRCSRRWRARRSAIRPAGGLALGVLYAAIPAGSLLAGCSPACSPGSAGTASWSRCGRAWGDSDRRRSGSPAACGSRPCSWHRRSRGPREHGLPQVDHAEAATDEMRGRMQGVFTVVVAGGPRIADLLHGIAGAAVGTALAVSGGGGTRRDRDARRRRRLPGVLALPRAGCRRALRTRTQRGCAHVEASSPCHRSGRRGRPDAATRPGRVVRRGGDRPGSRPPSPACRSPTVSKVT